ncbi:DUF2304 domain-containing protein [Thiohalocapsa marina]|uniref:DUF2304 domain-containing protein n=1 Tax=Thiohalocapsa marina TaxID=424902 RepID=A0A5M8FVN3_9GAMM|nr:DUF2304 domain-containing protein [Thiohalocapsa marina]KAA6187867.1 DUF2304 domain-containing protein [Thiohalocapsa marina]
MTYQLTSLLLGLFLGLGILWLIRRDHLHGPFALWWIAVAVTVVVVGFWPSVFDLIAHHLGVSYPPILALVLAFALILLKILTLDIERSRQERKIRRLAQQLSIIEADLNQAMASMGTTRGQDSARHKSDCH